MPERGAVSCDSACRRANSHRVHALLLTIMIYVMLVYVSTAVYVVCQGDRLSAGVANAQVRRKSDGFIVGGYAAEYKGGHTVCCMVYMPWHNCACALMCALGKGSGRRLMPEVS